MWNRLVGAVLFLGWALMPSSGAAEEFTAGGLRFSDELGGFRLISVSGTGSLADPIVVVEQVTTTEPAVLVIRGTQMISVEDGEDYPAPFINLALIKVVINATKRVWTAFDLELQESLRTPSPYEDGLSFDQLGSFADEPFRSDNFRTAHRMQEPYDRVQFYDGSVDPGATARFNLFITDPTPRTQFFLVQEPHLLIARLSGDHRQLAQAPAPVRP